MYAANTTRYDHMPYRQVDKSGLKLPSITLGLWHNFGDTTSMATQRVMQRAAFDMGIPISTWPITTARPTAAPKPISVSTCAGISGLTATN